MNKKIIIKALLVILLATSNNSKAQVISDAMSNKPLYQNASSDIKGSPFLLDKWSSAEIKSSRGVLYKDLKVKFDLFNNVLVYELNNNVYNLNERLDSFTLFRENSTTMKFINSTLINNKLPESYLEELIGSGNLQFYKSHKKYIAENAAYNTANGIKEFEMKTSYFIVRQDNTFFNISLSQNQLKKIVIDKWVEIDAYMKKNKLSAKNENDWVIIINYYNKLL